MKYNDPLHKLKFKRGSALPWSKLTEAQVIEARKLHEEKQETIRKLNEAFSIQGLADRYGVSKRTMERVLSGENWSHIP